MKMRSTTLMMALTMTLGLSLMAGSALAEKPTRVKAQKRANAAEAVKDRKHLRNDRADLVRMESLRKQYAGAIKRGGAAIDALDKKILAEMLVESAEAKREVRQDTREVHKSAREKRASVRQTRKAAAQKKPVVRKERRDLRKDRRDLRKDRRDLRDDRRDLRQEKGELAKTVQIRNEYKSLVGKHGPKATARKQALVRQYIALQKAEVRSDKKEIREDRRERREDRRQRGKR